MSSPSQIANVSSAGSTRKRPGLLSSERVFIFTTLAPAVVLLSIYVFFPILYSAYLSFFKTALFTAKRFSGFDNYVQVFSKTLFWTALGNTLVYTAVSVVLTLALGLLAAVVLNGPIRGRNAYRTILFIPYIIPYAAYALLWYWLFDPRYGLINYLLSFVGIDAIAWLKSKNWVIPAFILMGLWKRLGFTMVLFLAGLQNIPAELHDAATVDGANRWQRFRYVTLPVLAPITLFSAVIALISALQIFVEPLVMTHGGPGDSSQSLGYLIYQQGFVYTNVGQASVTALVLCALTFGFTWLLLRRFDSKDVFG
ncbi:MAG: sugar ABC transporter permease [Devosia sp.]